MISSMTCSCACTGGSAGWTIPCPTCAAAWSTPAGRGTGAASWNGRGPAAPSPSPTSAFEADELFDVLARLPSRQRAAIVLRFYEQMSDNEIAALLHCRPGTVASLVHRGCARLRGAMAEPGGGTMNVDPRDGFEDHLRGALARRAAALSAPADGTAPGAVAAAARSRRTRRQWGAATLALVVVLAASVGVVVAGGGSPRQTVAGPHLAPGQRLDRHDGVLVLPLSGTVSESPRRDSGAVARSEVRGFNGVAPGVSGDASARARRRRRALSAPAAGAPSHRQHGARPPPRRRRSGPSTWRRRRRRRSNASSPTPRPTACRPPPSTSPVTAVATTGGSGGDPGGSTVPTPPPTEVGPAETVPASGPVSPPAVVGPSIAVAPSVSPTSSTTRPRRAAGPASSSVPR